MTSSIQQLTLQDFLKCPNIEESPAWEFVEGQANQKPMPTAYHSILQKRLTAAIDLSNSPYEAFPELRCTLSNNSVVPDITVIHKSRIPVENTAVEGAPDWMIEILSPDQSTTKLIAKIQICLNEGTKLGWLIDPTEQLILILLPDGRISLLKNSDRLPVLPNIMLDLTAMQVFSWVRDR
ncbi:Uma2 family endonuclease [Aerosakkonemataceae cyanobacterium BLCC-F154]|uniref:Uma2 family endonuclease n=1 Tax=Floridaenema fluviatile BLCC-F154 TaxID=3153640 RepID=A0ABV4YEJ0_9CYAN